MKEDYERMKTDYYGGFPLTQEEIEKVNNWQNEHTKVVHKAVTLDQVLRLEGVSGGRWVYEFTPTAIGTFGSCICGNCRGRAIIESHGDMEKYREYLKMLDAEFQFQECV